MTAELAFTNKIGDILPMAQTFVPLCSLKPSYLSFLLERSSVEYVCAGQPIFTRNESDLRHIYLLSGRVKLRFASGYTEVLSGRDGRYALVNEMPRPCDAVADTDCSLLAIDSDRLDRILSWSQITQYLLAELTSERFSQADVSWIKTVVDSNLFYKVPPVNAEYILDKLESMAVTAGEVILRQGEIGDSCYFIKEGAARVTARDSETREELVLADIGAGRCFGEDALIYETVRNATVTMLTDGLLMRLEKSAFKILLVEPEIAEVDEADLELKSPSPVFIDVRTQQEYDAGHLAYSANIPLNLLAIKLRLLRPDVPYVLYCDTGRRSRAAAFLLSKQGFRAMALRGGLVGAEMQYQLINDAGYLLRDGRIAQC